MVENNWLITIDKKTREENDLIAGLIEIHLTTQCVVHIQTGKLKSMNHKMKKLTNCQTKPK
jgi:hypothetical protein